MDNNIHDKFNYNIELLNEEIIVIEDLDIEQDEIENIKTFFYSNEILLKLFKYEKYKFTTTSGINHYITKVKKKFCGNRIT